MKIFLKTHGLILGFAFFAFTAAFAQNPVHDDVYYVPGQEDVQPQNQQQTQDAGKNNQQDEYYSNSNRSTDDSGNTYVTNNYYNNDYYDYAYSARLRRFHHNYNYGYYDNYYTNSYWYDYNPYSYGQSIYLGYNWWNPPVYYYYHPSPFWVVGFSTYSYYDPWFYRPYFYGHMGYGYGQGYMNGFYDGMAYAQGYPYYHNPNANPYYFNTYDRTSYHYGPRNTSTGQGYRNAASSNSLGEKYVKAIESGRITDSRSNYTNMQHAGYKVENRGRNELQLNTKPENVRPTGNDGPVRETRPQMPKKENEVRDAPHENGIRPSAPEPTRDQPKEIRQPENKGTTRPVNPSRDEPQRPIMQPKQPDSRPEPQRPSEIQNPVRQEPSRQPIRVQPEQPRRQETRPVQPQQPQQQPIRQSQPSGPRRNQGGRISSAFPSPSMPSSSFRGNSGMSASHSTARSR